MHAKALKFMAGDYLRMRRQDRSHETQRNKRSNTNQETLQNTKKGKWNRMDRVIANIRAIVGRYITHFKKWREENWLQTIIRTTTQNATLLQGSNSTDSAGKSSYE
jgi:hypothetical protein